MKSDREPPLRIPHRRWGIGALLGAGVLVNYFDRISLSVAAPRIQAAFGLKPEQIGILLSAFFWSYALLQIPVGMLLDRFGVLLVARWGSFLWGFASILTAVSPSFGGLLVARALLGVAEAPGFPASAKATGHWFPRNERGLATALFDAAAKFSNVIGVPLVALAIVNWGWRWGFAGTACLSFAYFGAFYAFYRDPGADRKLSALEHRHILEGGASPEGAPAVRPAGMLGYLLTKTKVWGLILGFGAYGYTFYLFLTWLPSYLVRTMHVSILESAGLSTIPWTVATLADLAVGGWLIDRLIKGGCDGTKVRKTVLITGMVAGLAVFGATRTANPHWMLFWISVSLGGLASAAPVGWSLPSLVAPAGGAGTIGGLMNFSNNVMGAAAPVVTGLILGATQSFSTAFITAAAILLLGILSFVFLLGRIEPIEEPRAR